MIVPLQQPHSPPPARETGVDGNVIAGTEADGSEKVLEIGYDGKKLLKLELMEM